MITYWYKVYDIDIDVHHNVITCTITISGKEWSERYDRREVCRTSNRDVASNKALISDGSSENFSFDQYYKPIVLYIYSLLFLPRIDWKRRMLETNWSYSSLLRDLPCTSFSGQTMIKISKWVSRLDTIIIIKEYREISIRDDNNL